MNWKEYENKVFEALSAHYIDDVIYQNYKTRGIYSKRSRQIDIYIKERLNNVEHVTIIDSKNYNKKIDVKTVESFISMIEDVQADYGIIISELGFTKGALQRAVNNPKGIDVDIYDFKSLKHNLQSESAIPYSGENAVVILAPFGWIIDATKRDIPTICFLYKRGLSFEEAIQHGEFSYIDFWHVRDNISSIKELSDFQVINLEQYLDIESIEFQPSYNVLKKDAIIRIIRSNGYPFIEITGFIQFEDFIFFCVCNTTSFFVKRNLRKMHVLLKQVLPLKVARVKK